MTPPAATPAVSTPPADDLRYPIGPLTLPARFDAAWRAQAIRTIADTPSRLEQAVAGWSDARLDTPYRDGGWTVRQLVHHVADSHINAYVRFKLALTEEEPPVKGYEEAAWAELGDSARVPVGVSLDLLRALHTRWVALLDTMTEADFQRTLVHPEKGVRTLDQMLATYAWHGPHHVAHVTRLGERMGW
jgi:uncharacterized damage-inducible protein DinB